MKNLIEESIQSTNPQIKVKGKYKILPLSEKRKAVELLLQGETPIAEIAKQYGYNISTIRLWVSQVKRGHDRLVQHRRIPKKLKTKIIRELQAGAVTPEEVQIQYGIVDIKTIHNWVNQYSIKIAPSSRVKVKMEAIEKKKNPAMYQTLEQSLKDAQLKILALETMIDLAEEEFKINIRKKSGTKQLKK